MLASSSDALRASGIGTMPHSDRLPGFIGPVPQPLLIRLFQVVRDIIVIQCVDCQGRPCEDSVLDLFDNARRVSYNRKRKVVVKMALQMVHLLSARKWAQAHAEYADCPEFYLGAISPDAIHIRDGNDKSRKNEFHLYNWTSPDVEKVLEYWRENHSPFDVGYGIHVLTDAQWVPRFRARLKGLLYPDGRLDTSIYYNDTYVTDFELYRDCGGEMLFDLVERAEAPENHPLLTAAEFDAWRTDMLEMYRGECPKNDPVKYVTRTYVEEFIEDAQRFLNEVYEKHLSCR